MYPFGQLLTQAPRYKYESEGQVSQVLASEHEKQLELQSSQVLVEAYVETGHVLTHFPE
jgi:hypothetical protein